MNRAKQKGTSFETAVVNWLAEQGVAARRLPPAGNKDQGDVEVPAWGLNIEAKNCRALSLAQWVNEADVETINARKPVIVVAKRVGRGSPGEAYCIMPLRQLYFLLSAQSGLSDQSATLSE